MGVREGEAAANSPFHSEVFKIQAHREQPSFSRFFRINSSVTLNRFRTRDNRSDSRQTSLFIVYTMDNTKTGSQMGKRFPERLETLLRRTRVNGAPDIAIAADSTLILVRIEASLRTANASYAAKLSGHRALWSFPAQKVVINVSNYSL